MDRNVEFAAQLSRLVGLYAQQADDHAAEKAALRLARVASDKGAIVLSVEDGALRAERGTPGDDTPQTTALQDALVRFGVRAIHVAPHAKPAEIKALARLFGRPVAEGTDVPAFAAALAARAWTHVRIEQLADATVAEPEPALADGAGEMPVIAEPEPEQEPEQPPLPLPASSAPLATSVPDVVRQLEDESHRELFERLITSSEPGTLRRLLEPVQLVIEQSFREGRVSSAAQLLLAMFACEGLPADPEMRRPFVVVARRLTKPTYLRALAALFATDPQVSNTVEQVLTRFGQEGAEAVADRAVCAAGGGTRALYLALLRRLPGARDAIGAMLADPRPQVVERALGLTVEMRFADTEKLLADQLAHASARVRQAAARGLASFPASTFAADALLRAVPDPAPEVRLTAAVALQVRRDSRLAPALVQQLDVEPEFDVQLALVAALGRLAAHDGVQKLVALAMPEQRLLRRREGATLRLCAIEALGEARTPQAMVTLQKLLEDKDKDVRETAARLYSRARRHTTTGSVPAVSVP